MGTLQTVVKFGSCSTCYHPLQLSLFTLRISKLFFVSHFTFLLQTIKSWLQGPPTAERRRQRKLSGRKLLLFLQLFLLYFAWRIIVSSFCLRPTFYFSNAKRSRSWTWGPPMTGPMPWSNWHNG